MIQVASPNNAPKFAAQRNVLVADTSRDFGNSLRTYLNIVWPEINPNDTVEVTHVNNREDAEKLLDEKPFDVVVTASKLPELGGGLDLIRSLRAKVTNNPLVVMITADISRTAREVKEAGGDALYGCIDWAQPFVNQLKERFGETKTV